MLSAATLPGCVETGPVIDARGCMKKTLDIALLVSADADWQRGVMAGAAQYSDDVGGWRFSIPPADANGEVFLPHDWNGDGIICRVTCKELEDSIIARNIPAVNVAWMSCSTAIIPRVQSDERACAAMAARFLLEKQYENYGFVGFAPWKNYQRTVENEFAGELEKHGHVLHRFELSAVARHSQGIDSEQFTTWIAGIPKPLGLVVWNSKIGQQVINNCIDANIDVPNSVAVLSIEHDALWSSLARVPISNIDQDPWRIGFNAAKLLHGMIKGDSPPTEPVLVEPISIVQRKSTEALAVRDPVLDKAIKFIYQNAQAGISVADILEYTNVSRRGLETKFKQELDCTPAVFIRRIQLQAVARLLRSTKLTITAISERTGFAYPEVLMRSFKREFGATPMQFRNAGSGKAVQKQADRESL